MTDLNFDLNELLSSANAYDNKGAYQTLQNMINRKEVINVKFFTDKQSYPCAWIESKGVAGFKYQLKSESFKGLLKYLAKGEVTDFDTDPMNVETQSNPQEDFQLNIFKMFIEGGWKIQYVPLFRESNGYVSANLPLYKGKIFFRVERTNELLDYLRENNQTI